MKIIVYHTWYGCDTGCCGHGVYLYNEEPSKDDVEDYPSGYDQRHFVFDHLSDDEDPDEFAKQLIKNAFGEDKIQFYDKEHSKVMPNMCEFTMTYWEDRK
jgi:hypothetical protein